MKKTLFLLLVLGLMGGCDKSKPSSGSAPSATAPATPASTAAAVASAAPSAAPSASAASDDDDAVDDQEGLEKGEVVVGYIQDLKDEGQCAALPAPSAEKSKYDSKKLEEMATAMHSKVVKSCPDENVVGTCRMMGMLVNYTGPKYTADSAKKHCKTNKGKWFD